MIEELKKVDEEEIRKPPIFGTWRRFYTIVISELIFLIVIFYIFTKVFD